MKIPTMPNDSLLTLPCVMLLENGQKIKLRLRLARWDGLKPRFLHNPKTSKALINQPGKWVDEVHQRKPIKEIILDMDSSDSPTFGSRKVLPTMGISVIPVITPCSYSISLGIWSVPCFAMAMSIAADDWKSVLEPIIERYKR